MKISTVKEKSTGNEITVKDCEKGHDGEYICKTDGCNAHMSFVKAHEKRRLDKTIEIPSFLSLNRMISMLIKSALIILKELLKLSPEIQIQTY